MIPKLVVSRLSSAASRFGEAALPALKWRNAFPGATRSFSRRPPDDIEGGVLQDSPPKPRQACVVSSSSAYSIRARQQTDECQQNVLTLRKPGMNGAKAPWEIEAEMFHAPGGGVDRKKLQGAVEIGYGNAHKDHAAGLTRLVHWTEQSVFREHAHRHQPESDNRMRTVVDVGAGTGRDAFRWALNQVRVVATDSSEEQVRAIQAQAEKAQGAGDALLLQVMTAQGLEGVEADDCMHVRAARVPCYMTEAQFDEFLVTAHKLLGAEGTLYLSTYDEQQGWNQHTPGSPVLRLSSLAALYEQARAHGFSVERVCCEVNGAGPRMTPGQQLDATDAPINKGQIDALSLKVREDIDLAQRDPRLLGSQVVMHVLLRK